MDKDETKSQAQDASQNEDTSNAAKGSTSTTFTQSDIDKAMAKARSDALAEAGRKYKDYETKQKIIEEYERRRDEEEAEKYREKPDELKRIRDIRQKEKELNETKARLAALEAERAEREKTDSEEKMTYTVFNIAEKNGWPADVLKERCLKYGITDPVKIEDYAKEHNPPEAKAEYGKKRESPKVHVIASETGGKTNLDSLSPDEKIREGLKRLKK